MVMQLAQELGSYTLALKYRPDGSSTPRGLVGKVLRDADGAEKKRIVSEALAEFRELREKQGARAQTWSCEPSPNPPKRVVDNLLAASAASDFESARREWEYRGEILYEDDAAFAKECELCGPKERMQTNYVIHNLRTGAMLRVGSVCVKRFLLLTGTTSAAESAELFDHKTALATFGQSLKGYIADLGMERVPEKSIIALMGALERTFPQGLAHDDVEVVIKAAGVAGKAADVFRALATKDAKGLRGLKVQKMSNRKDRRQKVRRVLTTLSRSGAYRNPG
jgi:hypothetical protein